MNSTSARFHVVPRTWHDQVIARVYETRGYPPEEAWPAARAAAEATRHGIRTHNALKALQIERKHRDHGGGSVPGATITKRKGRFAASEAWDANRKLGPVVASEAIVTAMALADRHGIGQVSVDQACHYLWGGGYVLEAARRGFIAYTNCTAALSEVVPYGGRTPTLGTNPHSWAFPTQDAVGFPILVDWATSVIAMSRISQSEREGLPLPVGAAVDAAGQPTTDPRAARALLPFGAHKGYGLGLVNEIVAGFIGGSLPTLRNRGPLPDEKHTSAFYFQVIHPEALAAGPFAAGRNRTENLRAVIADILGHGNEGCRLPGQVEAEAAARSDAENGLLFSPAELTELNDLAREAGVTPLDSAKVRLAR